MVKTDNLSISRYFFEASSIVILLFFFLYTLGRACFSHIVHDEGALYLLISRVSYWDILTFNGLSSQNHMLYSLLAKFFLQFFKLSELSLRIPALLGHVLYLIGVYKILKIILDRRFLPFGVILMCSNPYMLDLFSLARGYSLGLGFLALGTYFFLKGLKTIDTEQYLKSFSISVWMVMFAVFSNFVFLDVYLAILTVLVGYQLSRCRGQELFLKKFSTEIIIQLRFVWLSAFFLFVICVFPILKMMGNSGYHLWFGGTVGFWQDTVSSLVWHSLYGQEYQSFPVMITINFILMFLFFISVGVLFNKWPTKAGTRLESRFFLGTIAVLFVSAIVTIAEWHVLGVRLRVFRTGCYFIFLFMITMVVLWQLGSKSKIASLKIVTHSFFALTALGMSMHFYRCANFNNLYLNRYGANSDTVVQYLTHRHKNQKLEDNAVTLGTHWIHLPSINFYKAKYGLSWLKSPKDIAKSKADKMNYYYVTTDGELLNNYKLKGDLLFLNTLDLEIMQVFPRSKHVLVIPAQKGMR